MSFIGIRASASPVGLEGNTARIHQPKCLAAAPERSFRRQRVAWCCSVAQGWERERERSRRRERWVGWWRRRFANFTACIIHGRRGLLAPRRERESRHHIATPSCPLHTFCSGVSLAYFFPFARTASYSEIVTPATGHGASTEVTFTASTQTARARCRSVPFPFCAPAEEAEQRREIYTAA